MQQSSQQESDSACTSSKRSKRPAAAKSPLNISNISSKTRYAAPRIAEVKALNEQIKTMQEKKQAEQNSKKYNENLVLRNFKKEFDAILVDFGLGPIQIKDKNNDSA